MDDRDPRRLRPPPAQAVVAAEPPGGVGDPDFDRFLFLRRITEFAQPHRRTRTPSRGVDDEIGGRLVLTGILAGTQHPDAGHREQAGDRTESGRLDKVSFWPVGKAAKQLAELGWQ